MLTKEWLKLIPRLNVKKIFFGDLACRMPEKFLFLTNRMAFDVKNFFFTSKNPEQPEKFLFQANARLSHENNFKSREGWKVYYKKSPCITARAFYKVMYASTATASAQ